MGRRTLLLITSILIAAVGTALVAIYVRGADERAEADADLVEVLVATKPVTAGTPAGTAAVNLSFDDRSCPQARTGDRRFTSLEQFVESTGDAVAVGPILPGQIIQAAMFDETPVATSTRARGRRDAHRRPAQRPEPLGRLPAGRLAGRRLLHLR